MNGPASMSRMIGSPLDRIMLLKPFQQLVGCWLFPFASNVVENGLEPQSSAFAFNQDFQKCGFTKTKTFAVPIKPLFLRRGEVCRRLLSRTSHVFHCRQ
jgi:hypothetical protein